MENGFELFIKERRYLQNVSERTVQWYEESFAWLGKYQLTEQGVKDFAFGMSLVPLAGLKPTGSPRLWKWQAMRISRGGPALVAGVDEFVRRSGA
jgi:hypothetical protein